MKALSVDIKMPKTKKAITLSDYKIFETNEFIKCIEILPRKDNELIKKKLLHYVYPQLKQEPHFGTNIKKLHGYEPDTWRYRIGKYRIFYIIEKQIVSIISIDYRKDAYK
jgi:mRNA interferase RelE/StbE